MLKGIDRLVAFFGRLAGGCTALLIMLIVGDVLLRFLFNLTAVWVVELEWHLFALIFLLGSPYALQQNKHVRVDLLYEKFSEADRAKVDFFGTLLLLLPWSALLFMTACYFLQAAWQAGEGSPNPGGLPTFVPIKAVIPFSALLLFLQGLAEAVRTYKRWQLPQKEEV